MMLRRSGVKTKWRPGQMIPGKVTVATCAPVGEMTSNVLLPLRWDDRTTITSPRGETVDGPYGAAYRTLESPDARDTRDVPESVEAFTDVSDAKAPPLKRFGNSRT